VFSLKLGGVELAGREATPGDEWVRGPGTTAPPELPGLEARILDLVETAIIAVDLSGRIIFVNPFASTLYGWTKEEMMSAPAGELMAVAIDGAVEAEIAAAIANGGSWQGTFDVRRKDGTLITVHAIDSPLHDGEGGLAGVVSVGWSAERERAAELLALERSRAAQVSQFLADCSVALASTTDYEEALSELGQRCVHFMADLCLIDVAEGARVRRVVAAYNRGDQRELVEELEARYPPDPDGLHPAIEALRTGKATVSFEMSEDFLRTTTRDSVHYDIVKSLNFQSYICVPLRARGRILGALTLVSCDEARRYGADDLNMAREVAWRASLVLDNARLFSESSHVAQVLQASLMPPSLPDIPGIELATRYVAFGAGVEVGGDFYDVFNAGYGAWVLTLGDVCGRGPEAAVVTGLIRHTIRSTALTVRQPGRLLAMANEVLLHEGTDVHVFTTLLCGILRPRAGSARLSLANAGHPPPIIVRANGDVQTPKYGDIMIGVFDDAKWAAQSIDLHSGDILVAYTDGITEARRQGEFFGEDRLTAVLQEARAEPTEVIADRVIDAVRRFAGNEPTDDLALIALRVS
jgi:PAS domain S-box-containing protein